MRRLAAAAAAIPLVLGLLVGCSSQPASIEGIAVDDRGGGPGGPDAAIDGVLRLDDGCFYVETRDGIRWVVSFPQGDVERVGDGVRFDRTTYEVGDDITVRGQDVRPATLQAPPTCDLANVWMAFSTGA